MCVLCVCRVYFDASGLWPPRRAHVINDLRCANGKHLPSRACESARHTIRLFPFMYSVWCRRGVVEAAWARSMRFASISQVRWQVKIYAWLYAMREPKVGAPRYISVGIRAELIFPCTMPHQWNLRVRAPPATNICVYIYMFVMLGGGDVANLANIMIYHLLCARCGELFHSSVAVCWFCTWSLYTVLQKTLYVSVEKCAGKYRLILWGDGRFMGVGVLARALTEWTKHLFLPVVVFYAVLSGFVDINAFNY